MQLSDKPYHRDLSETLTHELYYNPSCTSVKETEAWWHIVMLSASHWEDPGSNPGKGRVFRIKMKNVMFELYKRVFCNNTKSRAK